MFSLSKGVYDEMVRKDEFFVAVLGLDGAGKTTFVEQVKAQFIKNYVARGPSKISSTVGLNLAKVDCTKAMLNLWDLGGHPDLQSLWSNYLDECHAVIYVIDLSDRTRIDEAIEAFEKPLAFERVRHLPILIALNKCDQCEEETGHATNGMPSTANGSAATVDRSRLHERLEELCAAAQHSGDMAVISISAISSHNVAKCVQWLLSALIQKAQAEPPARA